MGAEVENSTLAKAATKSERLAVPLSTQPVAQEGCKKGVGGLIKEALEIVRLSPGRQPRSIVMRPTVSAGGALEDQEREAPAGKIKDQGAMGGSSKL